ncbi:MAG: DUF1192 domain-containing protein [Pseudomonadota bacterium]
MDELDPKPSEVETYRIGESLYGLSVHELEARIAAYGEEILRLEVERDKKSRERSAADALFAPKS